MQNNKNGFTFIEVLVAISILSIAVFGVYKLIGENTKIITISGNHLQMDSLFPILEECIEYINYDFGNTTIGSGYTISLGSSDTLTGCINNTNGTIIDEIKYELYGEITATGVNFIDRKLKISSDQTNTSTGFYKQIK